MRSTPSTSQNSTEEPSWSLIRLVEPDRHDEEQPDREDQRERRRPRPGAAGDLLSSSGSWALAEIPSALSRSRATRERDDAADHRPAVEPVALGPRDAAGTVWTVDRRPSCGPRLGVARARLADADRPGETPRIITPSSTAWPPTAHRAWRVRRPSPAPAPATHSALGAASASSSALRAALGGAALEALDAATGVDQLLLAGVERMAGRSRSRRGSRAWSSGS